MSLICQPTPINRPVPGRPAIPVLSPFGRDDITIGIAAPLVIERLTKKIPSARGRE
jgi:hypothetical protein